MIHYKIYTFLILIVYNLNFKLIKWIQIKINNNFYSKFHFYYKKLKTTIYKY